jgi:adenosine deaminase
MSDQDLAGLARMSVLGSAAPASAQKRLLAGIDEWLAAPAI